MHTIVELPQYLREAKRLLSEKEREAIINYLATNPKAGVIMQGTGGIRKLRWTRPGTGKRGGVRIIYYYYNQTIPLYLLTLFAKGDKSNLSKAEQNELVKFIQPLVKSSPRKRYE